MSSTASQKFCWLQLFSGSFLCNLTPASSAVVVLVPEHCNNMTVTYCDASKALDNLPEAAASCPALSSRACICELHCPHLT